MYDDEFDFNDFLYKTEIRKGEKAPGIATKKDTREKMYDLLLSLINENPKRVKGVLLQEELRSPFVIYGSRLILQLLILIVFNGNAMSKGFLYRSKNLV